MTNEAACPISGELHEEERVNYATHLIGLLMSLLGFGFLLFNVDYGDNTTRFLSCLIYGTTLVLLYGASTYYHGTQCLSRKKVLKVVDHICIYLLIAGSYTPFTLGPLKERGGVVLFCIVWSIALVGTVFKIVAINRFQLFSVFAYLGMGWLIVFNLPAVIDELPLWSFVWLMAGGAAYSLGTIFYVWDGLPFNHAIWHLFVIGGSSCHYFSILECVKQAS